MELTRAVRRRGQCSEEGFTLLEVLIAMSILGLGILSIGLAQLSSMKMSSKSRSLQQAMYLAQEGLDRFMTLPANDTELTTAVTDQLDDQFKSGGVVTGQTMAFDEDAQDNVLYTRRWTVEPNTPSTGLTRVTVFVSWDSAHSSTHEVELQGIRRVGS